MRTSIALVCHVLELPLPELSLGRGSSDRCEAKGDRSASVEGASSVDFAGCCRGGISKIQQSVQTSVEASIPLAAQLVVYPNHRRHLEGQGLC